MGADMDAETNRQNLARRVWDREGGVCLSFPVHALAKCYGGDMRRNEQTEDLLDMIEQAFELSTGIPDYEETALQNGWKQDPETGAIEHAEYGNAEDWEDACREADLEPYEREVYEHWSVSNWLGEKLKAKGEKVDDDFMGLTVWARTCSGQSIVLDGVMQAIAMETLGKIEVLHKG